MISVTLRLNKDKHVYVPKHKVWVQMYKQNPVTSDIELDEEGNEIKSKDWVYEAKQIEYNKEWEGNTEIVEGEEVELTVEQYLYNNFNETFDKN